MGMTYLEIHLWYTLPVLGLLLLVARPLLTRFDLFKLAFLVGMAFAAASPWDSWIIRKGVWSYPAGSVVGTALDVPFEEYAFFLIQTLVTGITYVLLTRPLLPSLSVPHTPTPSALRLGWAALLLPVSIAFELSRRSDHFLYLFAELLLVTPPLLLLFGTSTRFAFSPSAGRRTATGLSIVLPTLYFCWVDKVAIGEGAWFMNERWVTGVTFFKSLPLEEALFFFMVNVLIVMGLSAVDHTLALHLLHPDIAHATLKPPTTFPFFGRPIWSLVAIPAERYPALPQEDLQQAVGLLEKKSRSFWVASAGFGAEVREKLVALYSFCRVTDDLIDSPAADQTAEQAINMIGDYLDLIFGPNSMPSEASGSESSSSSHPGKRLPAQSELLPAPHPARPCGSWPIPEPPVVSETEIDRFLADRVPAEAHFSFRLLARLTRLIPRYPIDELLRGYSLDLAFPLAPDHLPGSSASPIKRLDDLLDYGLCVAGSVAELIVYLAWAERSDQVPPTVEGRETVLVKSREMGTALQLVNIARDLAGDGDEGRCYLPLSWFSGAEALPAPPAGSPPRLAEPSPDHLPLLLSGSQEGFPWSTYALPLLGLADQLAASSRPGIDLLPSSARAGVRAAAGGYLLIGKEIKNVWRGDVRERRTVKGWRRVLAVVYEVWCR